MADSLYNRSPFVLASASPRRGELLSRIGLPFEIVPSPFEENFGGASPREEAERLARRKVEALLLQQPELGGGMVLGADTVIDIEGRVLGKPADAEEAEDFLRRLSGRSHRVITSLALYTPPSGAESASRVEEEGDIGGLITVESEITAIRIASLSKEERSWYVATGEWKGAAGGYRIQGAGALFVEGIEGCYFNVMGLPLHLFYGMLRKRGYDLLEAASGISSAV